MNLADFPMDIQRCPLKFGSCKYSILHTVTRICFWIRLFVVANTIKYFNNVARKHVRVTVCVYMLHHSVKKRQQPL